MNHEEALAHNERMYAEYGGGETHPLEFEQETSAGTIYFCPQCGRRLLYTGDDLDVLEHGSKQAAYHPIPALMFDALAVPGLRFEVSGVGVYGNDEAPFQKFMEEGGLE